MWKEKLGSLALSRLGLLPRKLLCALGIRVIWAERSLQMFGGRMSDRPSLVGFALGSESAGQNQVSFTEESGVFPGLSNLLEHV